MPAAERSDGRRPDREDGNGGQPGFGSLGHSGLTCSGTATKLADGTAGPGLHQDHRQVAYTDPEECVAGEVLPAHGRSAERRPGGHCRSPGRQHHRQGNREYCAHHSCFHRPIHQQAY
jgi:hypothetical protein